MIKKRKRRSDRNHVIYMITNVRTKQEYVGLTAVSYGGNVNRTVYRRFQKHVQRAISESKQWTLCKAIRKHGADRFAVTTIEVVRGKAVAHVRELEIIRERKPALNTFC